MPEQRSSPIRKAKCLRRWARRALLGALVLLIGLIVIVQIFLWTDYPRKIVIAQIQKRLGVQASLKSIDISWLGHTRLTDLTLSTPMSGGPLLHVSSMRLTHRSLPFLAFTQDIDRITLVGVQLDLREQPDAKWNIQQLLGASRDESKKSPANLDLPDIVADNVQVRILRRDNRQAELRGISVNARQSAALEYTVEARLGESIALEGKTALAGDFQHELTVTVSSLPAGIEQLTGAPPDPLRGEMKWQGRRTADGITGTLELRDTLVSWLHAEGVQNVFTNADHQLVIEPRGLTLQTGGPSPAICRLDSGKVILGEKVRLTQLRGQCGGGTVALDGWLNPATLDGDISLAWQQVDWAGIISTGQASLQTAREFTGKLIGNGQVRTSVELADGIASGELTIRAEADTWQRLKATIQTRPFSWTFPNGRTLVAPSCIGAIESNGEKLALRSFHPVDPSVGEVAATGEFSMPSHFWWASIDSRGLKLSDARPTGLNTPIDMNLSASGTSNRMDVHHFFLRQGTLSFWSNGFYDSTVPAPVNLNTWMWFEPAALNEDDAELKGLTAHGRVVGSLKPRELHAEGRLSAEDLSIRDNHLGRLSVDLVADVTGRRARLRSRDIDLLGAVWTLRGDWRAFSGDPLTIVADWKHLPLDRLGALLKTPGLSGTIDTGAATFTLPSLRLNEIQLDAKIHATDLKAPRLEVDSMDTAAQLIRGRLTADSTLKQGAAQMVAAVSLNLLQSGPITFGVDLDQWPTDTSDNPSPIRARLSGKITGDYLAAARRLNLQGALAGPLNHAEQPLGDLTLQARLEDQALTIDSAHLAMLDGQVSAQGRIDLRRLDASRLEMDFQHLALDQLAWLRPELADLAGRFSGSISLHPSADRRALGPAEIVLSVQPEAAHFRAIPLGPIDITGYADYASPAEYRLVTDHARIHLSGGVIQPFARLSCTPARGLTQIVTAEVKDLDLDPIVRAFSDDDKPVIGRLDAAVNVFGPMNSLETTTVDANLRLRQSDLVNFGPISLLYNLMHAGGAGPPRGEGTIALRLEQSNLNIVSASYFNRGVYAHAYGNIHNLEKMGAAQNDYTVIGSVRLLKDIRLPYLADADKLISAFQSRVTTVYVSGSLKHPKSKKVTLSELGDTLRAIVLGKVREDR